MGKYAGIIIGLVVTLLGLIGLKSWWNEFLTIAKGSIPLILVLAGIIAVIAGLSELKDMQAKEKEADK